MKQYTEEETQNYRDFIKYCKGLKSRFIEYNADQKKFEIEFTFNDLKYVLNTKTEKCIIEMENSSEIIENFNCKQHLGPVTKEQMKKTREINKENKEKQLHYLSETLTFDKGKYKNQKITDVITTNYQYVVWYSTLDHHADYKKLILDLLMKHKPTEQYLTSINNLNDDTMHVGKYKGMLIEDAVKLDYYYVQWYSTINVDSEQRKLNVLAALENNQEHKPKRINWEEFENQSKQTNNVTKSIDSVLGL